MEVEPVAAVEAPEALLEASETPERLSWFKQPLKRKLYDIVFALGYICCLIAGAFPNLSIAATIGLIICFAVSFLDDNFYLYMALFIYVRYRMLLFGDIPAFRIYRYLLAFKFLLELPRMKFKVAYLPGLLVFFLHSTFAMSSLGTGIAVKQGLNVIVDCVLIYMLICRMVSDDRLMRRFIFVFLMGGVVSGVYGWASDIFTKNINVSGAGVHKVSRNFGALSDANFAGMFYSLCIICTLMLKKIPLLLRLTFLALFTVMILQTASISALITLATLAVFMIILRYRKKAVFILLFAFVAICVVLGVLLAIPQFREIDAIAGLLIRFNEKLSYLSQGRWDLLTTGRYDIWMNAISIFNSKPLWGKLIGGSVITVISIDQTLVSIACHNSYIQGLLDFGVLGTLLVYLPMLAVFFVKLVRHFIGKPGAENEDLDMIRLIFPFTFIVFGTSVDFFLDWTFLMLYFM